jgi:hypothetical protein
MQMQVTVDSGIERSSKDKMHEITCCWKVMLWVGSGMTSSCSKSCRMHSSVVVLHEDGSRNISSHVV